MRPGGGRSQPGRSFVSGRFRVSSLTLRPVPVRRRACACVGGRVPAASSWGRAVPGAVASASRRRRGRRAGCPSNTGRSHGDQPAGAPSPPDYGDLGTAGIEGGAGADTIRVRLDGVSVSGGGGADRIVLRPAHDDVTVVLNAGEAEGDVIAGFEGAGTAGGDRLEFYGFGADGTVTALGDGRFEVASADGVVHNTFMLEGVAALSAGDFAFVVV